MKLGTATLPNVAQDILTPNYDRSRLRPGIVHIGMGNFHRAHQAWYLHRLMQQGLAQDWAIIGAGVRAPDNVMRDKLLAQDGLFTLVELDPSGQQAEVVGSVIGFLPVQEDNAALIAQMADPAIRIVSLTVTEGGYYYDAATGKLDSAHPDIQHDAANPMRPRTAFGAMVAALSARRAAGHAPFTAQSCDNLQGNGTILRRVICALANMSDPDLAQWIDTHGAFPNSMVDCIVPATGPAELQLVQDLGIDDDAPVTHENFRQWVIEDAFCTGRPPWEEVGATLTGAVHDYESMKIRMLNAGHQVLANAGELLGHGTIADCMADPLIARFFAKVEKDEIAPHVTPVPGMTPAQYVDLIAGRFANPSIRDTVRRVAFDGSARHAGFVLPILRDALAGGTPIAGLALVEALWARMCAGTREDGSRIEANDPHWDALAQAATAAQTQPSAWLAQTAIYGALGDDPRFVKAFEEWLSLIWSQGSSAALRRYVDGT